METSLLFAQNMFGSLNPAIIKRIERYLNHPTIKNWDDIHCIIISTKGKMPTIWNAVIDVDPCFPRKGRTKDFEGKIINEWERIPEPELVVKAIKNVVYSKNLNLN